MTRRQSVILAVLLLTVQMARAQWDVQFSDFTTLRSYYNPAAAGVDGLLNVSAAYSAQMAGYEHAPSTMLASVDLPVYFLGPRHGAGASLLSDQIGIFRTQVTAVKYACNMNLGKKKKAQLAIGVQGALIAETINPKGLILEDSNDPAFPSSSVDGKRFDLGAGLYLKTRKFWAGLSAQHLLAESIEVGETHQINLSRTIYFMSGGNIKLKNTLLSLQPAIMMQTDLDNWREDIQCCATYEYEGRKFYAGLGYSPDISVTALIGGYFHGIKLGYSYQMYTSGVGIQNGAHELVFNYQTDLDLFKKGKNKHKSVRFL